IASCIRCCRCQSAASPSSAEYWHMGATTMRLGRSMGPTWSGEKRCGTGEVPYWLDGLAPWRMAAAAGAGISEWLNVRVIGDACKQPGCNAALLCKRPLVSPRGTPTRRVVPIGAPRRPVGAIRLVPPHCPTRPQPAGEQLQEGAGGAALYNGVQLVRLA